MTDLNISETKITPGVHCHAGYIRISGRSISPGSSAIFEAVNEWLKHYLFSPEEITTFDVKLEYIDASSSKVLFSILKNISEHNKEKTTPVINWHYEYGDMEMLQLGEIFQARINLEFDFIELQ